MKTFIQILIRWFIILGIILFIYQVGKAQDCCVEFELINKNDTLKKNQLVAVEIPPGKMAVISFVDIPVVTIINIYDNVDPLIIYAGTWYNGNTTAPGFSNNTMAYSNLVGNTITFQFTGKRIEWIAEQKIGAGRVGVIIDSRPEEIINLGLSNVGNGVVKGWDLTPGFHTIKIKVLDAKYVVSDGFKVTSQ